MSHVFITAHYQASAGTQFTVDAESRNAGRTDWCPFDVWELDITDPYKPVVRLLESRRKGDPPPAQRT